MDLIYDYRQLILKSTERVTNNASHVRVDVKAAERLARALAAKSDWLTAPPEKSLQDAPLFANEREHAQWLFALDSVNFSFWSDHGEARWRFADDDSKLLKGAIAMGESFRAAARRGVPLTDARFLAQLTPATLREILGGQGPLPMLEERCRVLNEAGKNLSYYFDGQIANLLERARGCANDALALLLQYFPSFRDIAQHNSRSVYFLKRAQIFISDLHLVFGGEGPGRFEDMETLTAFADYKLPQLLRHAGVLEYGPHLAALVDNQKKIPHASNEEVEIRAAAVQAVEQLQHALERELGQRVLTCKLDNLIWWLSHGPDFEDAAPHHRTRTIFY